MNLFDYHHHTAVPICPSLSFSLPWMVKPQFIVYKPGTEEIAYLIQGVDLIQGESLVDSNLCNNVHISSLPAGL